MKRNVIALAAAALVAQQMVGASAAPVCRNELVGVNERCPTWTGSYNHPEGRGGNGEDIGRALAVSPSGDRVYVTGQSRDDATAQDQAVVAFDSATGQRLWASRWETMDFDTGSAIVATGDAVFVTGRTGPVGNLDWITAAYSAANGQQLWAVRYTNSEALELDDTAYGIGTSLDGSTVFVTGGIGDGIGVPGDIRTVAYDATDGSEVWAHTFDGGGYDGSFFLEPAPDGERLYVGGNSRTATTDAVALAYDARGEDAGDLLWTARLDGPGGRIEGIEGIDVSADGARLAMTATSRSAGADGEYLTGVYDTESGSQLWRKTYNGTRAGDDVAGGVAIAGTSVVVTGRSSEQPAGSEYGTIAYALETGDVRWTQLGNTPPLPDQALDIEASPSGSHVYVTGYVNVPRGEIRPAFNIEPGTIMTIAYDVAAGTRSWVAHHNESGIGADVGVDVEVSPNGQTVFLGGTFVFSGVYVYVHQDLKPYAYDFGVVAYPA